MLVDVFCPKGEIVSLYEVYNYCGAHYNDFNVNSKWFHPSKVLEVAHLPSSILSFLSLVELFPSSFVTIYGQISSHQPRVAFFKLRSNHAAQIRRKLDKNWIWVDCSQIFDAGEYSWSLNKQIQNFLEHTRTWLKHQSLLSSSQNFCASRQS